MASVNQQWYTLPDARRYLREINPKLTDEEIETLLASATVCWTPEEMKGPGVGLLYGVVTRRRR
jgi:hypothetical protein